MVANSSDLVTLLAADGTIFYQSDSIVRILGYQQDELTGHLSLDFVHPDDRMYIAGSLARSVANHEAVVLLTYRFKKADGSWCYLESIGTNLLDHPALQCIVVNSRDVTKRVTYEDELIAAKEKAEEMSRLKSTFLTNMSHEIRTPLTGIIGAADVLKQAYDGDLNSFIDIISNSGSRLLETFNSVLDLAQLEGNAVDISTAPVDLAKEVRKTVHFFKLQAQKKGLDLSVHLPETVPMLTSRNMIQRVLTNLLSNAIKFTEAGAITVTVEADTTTATICVQDTGIGIRESFLPHVFDEFEQESTGLTRSYQGNGLGLAISKRIVRLLKGTINVASVHGAGTRFTVQLPLELPLDDQDLSNHYNG
jgi:PAS domain S-box-containing protein